MGSIWTNNLIQIARIKSQYIGIIQELMIEIQAIFQISLKKKDWKLSSFLEI